MFGWRHHRTRRRLRGAGYFKRLGPGLVTGAADDDPSGIGTYSQVGAAYGTGILWSTLFVAPMAAAVQEMAARLGLVTGRGLSTLLRERFPRWVLYVAVLLVAIANPFNIAADLASMGAAVHLVVTIGTAEQAAQALKPLAGDLAGLVFATGIVGLGLLAVPVLAGSTAYAMSEAVGWNEGLSKRFREAHGFYGVIVFSMLVGLGLNFVGLDPIRGLYYAAILNGVTAPPLIVLMLILSRSERLLGNRRTRMLSLVVVATTIAASVILPIVWFTL